MIKVGSRVYDKAAADSGIWDTRGTGIVREIRRSQPLYASGNVRRGTGGQLRALVEWEHGMPRKQWEAVKDLAEVE